MQTAAFRSMETNPARMAQLYTEQFKLSAVKAGETIAIDADPGRHLYLVPSGRVRVNGIEAAPRDGVAITDESKVEIEAEEDSELVLVDAR